MAFIAIRIANAGDAGDPNDRHCGTGHDDPDHARTDHGNRRRARRAAGSVGLAVDRHDKSWRPDEQQRCESLW